jgi:hydrogenase expression/formation protein HypC
MCLGVPGKIVEVTDNALLRMGKVDFGGVVREVCLAYVPEADLGDYVVVHVGFAISQIDEEEARQTFDLMKEAGILEEEWGDGLFVDENAPGS